MTIEQGFLWFAELLMLIALACFVQGFRVRKSDNALHQRLGKIGALLVIVGLAAVEVLLRGFGWKFPVRDATTLHVHIAVASGALLLLLALVVTGMKGPKKLHVKLYVLFFPLYFATVVTSVLAFRLW
jgi:hypothetical protein